MAFYQPAFPKPGGTRKYVAPVRTYRDGREVIRTSTRAGRELYQLRLRIMWERQGRMCGLQISGKCRIKLPLRLAQFDHSDGKPVNCAACVYCNAEKGSRRLDVFEI
jgi:hypothetical protein